MTNCTLIKLKAVDQRLTVVQQPTLASGDVETVRVEYALDDFWDGYAPSGTFYTGKNPDAVYEQPLVEGACIIPWEVLKEGGSLYIGLRGVDAAGRVKTSVPVRYHIERGSPRGSNTANEPTPDVYEQILQVASNAEKIANKVRSDADAGKFDGKDGVSSVDNGIIVIDDPDAMKAVAIGTASGDETAMKVRNSAGVVRINGIEKRFGNATRTFSISTSDRIQVECARLERATGEITYPFWLECTEENGVLTRKSDGSNVPLRSSEYLDIVICIVRIPANTDLVTQDMIEDTRPNAYYCGLVSETYGDFVRFDQAQERTDAERMTAQYNVGILSSASGVAKTENDDLKINIRDGLMVRTTAGTVYLLGRKYAYKGETKTFQKKTSDGRAALVFRLNKSSNSILPYWKWCKTDVDGLVTISEGDTLPVRNETYYDIVIAYVHIPANAEQITEDMIYDLRGDTAYCGYVEYLIGGSGETYAPMVGASSTADGAAGLVPAPKAGQHGKFLRGDGTWADVPQGGGGGTGNGDMQKTVYDPMGKATDVFAYAENTAESKVSAHNTESGSHGDIRNLITGLTNRLNALADSDDTTLDQLSEIVAYIKSNKSLIDAITTEKVSVSDIINNLTTNNANKPLSAAQGVALKALIDGITIPDKLPNPNALTFTGAVSGSYDGSAAVSVEIPSAVTDDHINSLIDTKLGVIENGSY